MSRGEEGSKGVPATGIRKLEINGFREEEGDSLTPRPSLSLAFKISVLCLLAGVEPQTPGTSPAYVTEWAAWADSPLGFLTADFNVNSSTKIPVAEKRDW